MSPEQMLPGQMSEEVPCPCPPHTHIDLNAVVALAPVGIWIKFSWAHKLGIGPRWLINLVFLEAELSVQVTRDPSMKLKRIKTLYQPNNSLKESGTHY